MRYRLTIAYDGTDFCGWQKQYRTDDTGLDAEAPDDEPSTRAQLRTVQGVVEAAVREVVADPGVMVVGASRTDAGVHARAQTAAFTTADDRRGPADDRLALAINSRLPPDILVRSCDPAGAGFDPIGDCLEKGYRYTVRTGLGRPLWDRRYVFHSPLDLADEPMQAAAALLVGEHDFAGFTRINHGRESTVRTVTACTVIRTGSDTLRFDVAGTGFLYNMVRIIAGTLVEVGRGRLGPADVERALETGDRRAAGPTLPPEGLSLMWMRYPAPIGLVGDRGP